MDGKNKVFFENSSFNLKQDIFEISASLCLYAPICYIINGIFAYFLNQNMQYSVCSFVLSFLPIGIIILILNRNKGLNINLCPQTAGTGFSVFIFTLLGLMVIPLNLVLASFIKLIYKAFSLPVFTIPALNGSINIILFFVANVILAPLFEEILFRSVLLNRIKKYGVLFAVIISSFLFSLAHMSFQSFLYAFISGIIFALIDIKCSCILPSLIVHFTNNLFSCITVLLSQSKNDYAYNILVKLTIIFCILCFIVGAFIYFCKNFYRKKGTPNICLNKTSHNYMIFFKSPFTVLFIIISVGMAIFSLFY